MPLLSITDMLLADPNVGGSYKHALTSSREVRRAQYVVDLKRMDWQFEHSDDQNAWRSGTNELKRLRTEQREVDQDGVLWRLHAHPDFPLL